MELQRRQIALREKSWHPYIPSEVLAQLNGHLHELPDPVRGMVLVLLECGLRVSELCALPIDCLVSDASGNQFLRSVPSKEGGERILPLSEGTARIIQEQQTMVQGMHSVKGPLFLDSTGQAIGPDILMKQINRLAVEKNICDSSGALWRFRAPQFRATLAGLLVERQVPLQVLQQYFGPYALDLALRVHIRMLGHRSSDTLSYYLHL